MKPPVWGTVGYLDELDEPEKMFLITTYLLYSIIMRYNIVIEEKMV